MSADYIHRVGRTARAGRGGAALTFVSQYDIEVFKSIEETVGREMNLFDIEETAVLELLKGVNAAKRMAKIRLEDFQLTKKVVKRKRGADDDDDDADGNDGGNEQLEDRLGSEPAAPSAKPKAKKAKQQKATPAPPATPKPAPAAPTTPARAPTPAKPTQQAKAKSPALAKPSQIPRISGSSAAASGQSKLKKPSQIPRFSK